MFRLILLLSLSAALTSALQFTDCATDKANKVLTVHQLDLSPSPILFPGEIHATINLTVNQRITHLFIDTKLEKETLGIWTKLPCIGTTNIGSCANIDACTILDRILNGSSIISQDFGRQIDAILLSALGHKASCPIDPETVFVDNEKLMVQEIPAVLTAITTGTYRITISVKDDSTNPDNLGCIQFEVSIGKGNPAQTVG